ncbi:MAG: mannose-1-phosphate guanylyltransferase/mannose-6-phosphate isomerase [Pseudohongiella sp.]|nr:mannose-1-phosphate guanylyltransferase/mannose-6-phosphate isomerase [Pseudohongiella sp.]
MIIPVILAGGTGSRLWPLSRQLSPKQFMTIPESMAGSGTDSSELSAGDHSVAGTVMANSDTTLFQATLLRLQGIPGLGAPLVICNEEHRFLVAEQLRQLEMTDAIIVLEPVGRNTAPALTLAAELIGRLPVAAGAVDDEPLLMLVLPADHVIRETVVFHACIETARQHASAGAMVTFGIRPLYAETGYGYIQRGPVVGDAVRTAFKVKRFVEKPALEVAQQYLDAGDYDWNSGMFLFGHERWLQEVEQHAPEIARHCRQACHSARSDGDFTRIDAVAFAACPSDSIDYAVMEKTANAVIVPMEAAWNDLGAWSSLWDVSSLKTKDNNVLRGDTHVINVSQSYIRADSRLVVAIGMHNAVIVETPDAVLVADKDQVQDVKKVVQWLEQMSRPEAVLHTLVYRPWGSYESLATGPGFQVKRIRVRPGASLSLQMHHKRAEHWVVIQGVATVTCDERVFDLHANQSTFIPLGSRHRLQNMTDEWVELIEVQTGAYLGEDDIVRFDDVYGRVQTGVGSK